MHTTEFHLYRAKFIKPAQIKLFDQHLSSRNFFEGALDERPSISLRRNNVWHVGNLEYVDKNGGRFAIGRTTKTTIEKFDDQTGNFIEELDDSGPYTYVYFDSEYGYLAIAKKTKVAPAVKQIAKKLQALLANAKIVTENSIEVRVDIIPDPEDFLKKIHKAYAIKRFTADFTGPNPIDADELFQKPLSIYCQKLNGTNGTVAVRGDDLDEETVAAVAKSTAATGNQASALIQPERGRRLISVSLDGNAVKVIAETDAQKSSTLKKIRESYHGVRQ